MGEEGLNRRGRGKRIVVEYGGEENEGEGGCYHNHTNNRGVSTRMLTQNAQHSVRTKATYTQGEKEHLTTARVTAWHSHTVLVLFLKYASAPLLQRQWMQPGIIDPALTVHCCPLCPGIN